MKTIALRIAQVLGAFVLGFVVWTVALLVLVGTVKLGPLVVAGTVLLVGVSYAVVRVGLLARRPGR